MNSQLILSICAALFTIVTMLWFCLDLLKRSYMLIEVEAKVASEPAPQSIKQPLL